MWKRYALILLTLELVIPTRVMAQASGTGEAEILSMLQVEPSYHVVTAEQFENLGWQLPDAGQAVKKLADNSPGGAFNPRALEALNAEGTGYTAQWHELRYQAYGLDWDITGLYLLPKKPVEDMPTMVLIHGGSSNWYEFFLDPLNNPGLGQYLAQKVPVLLVTIPGNYRHGGWTDKVLERRVPAYVLDREMSSEEVKIRNSVYTFQLVTDGVRKLVETVTTGPVVVTGHSTAGEIPYMLHGTSLKDRMHGWILGWGSGGTSAQKAMQDRWGYTQTAKDYPPVTELRPRPTSGYAEDYLGPLNPVWEEGKSRQAIADRWMGEREFRRRPHFKQPLQDIERRGAIPGMRDDIIRQVRQALAGNELGVDVDQVEADLFAPMRAPVNGYKKVILATTRLDTGHWNKDNPARASTVDVVNDLRALNPDIPVRALLFDVPMTHYGHIERPQQLAAGLFTALTWLTQP
jgi:hypothetical protein